MNLSHCHTAVIFIVPGFRLTYTRDKLSLGFTPHVRLIVFILIRCCVVPFPLHWPFVVVFSSNSGRSCVQVAVKCGQETTLLLIRASLQVLRTVSVTLSSLLG